MSHALEIKKKSLGKIYMKKAIIYVSSNREDPEFERKTRETLIKNSGGIPIISVTQKPVNLGRNICVGDVGASGFNFCRQVLIACESAVGADVVISAESDCIYPPDYFEFNPKRLDIAYRNTNIYVQRRGEDYCFKKNASTFSQLVGRDHYIKRLRLIFEGQPIWNVEMKNFPKEIGRPLLKTAEYYESKNPCFSFKTGKGMRNWTSAGTEKFYEIPYWGSIKKIREHYEQNI